MEDIYDRVLRKSKILARHQEQYVKAFIARTGCDPSNVILLIQNGSPSYMRAIDPKTDEGKLHQQLTELFQLNSQLKKENEMLRKELGLTVGN